MCEPDTILTTDAREDVTVGPNGFITINFAYNIGIGLSPSIMEPHADGRGASQVNRDSYESGIKQRDFDMEQWILDESYRAIGSRKEQKQGLTDGNILSGLSMMEEVAQVEVEKWGGDDYIHSMMDYKFSPLVEVDAEFRHIIFWNEGLVNDNEQWVALSRKLASGLWSLWQVYKLDDRDKFWFYVETPYIPVYYPRLPNVFSDADRDAKTEEMILKHHCAVGQLWLTEQNGYCQPSGAGDSEDEELMGLYRHFVSQVREGKTNINPAYADHIFEAERSFV